MSAVVSSAYKMKNFMPISYFLVVVNFEDTTEVVLVDSLVNMSSHHKDPHKKKDTPSESSESHSDSEAEENLEQLKRGKRETKDDPGESKPLGSPNLVGGETTSIMLQEKSPVSGSSRLRGEVDYPKFPTYACSIYSTASHLSSSPRHFVYASDSAHTSWDASEIRSEIADISTEGGALQSSSESAEPKSSSSGDSHRKESSDIRSSPEVQECSKSEKGRKSWQTPGLLRSMQHPAMSSKDSVIAEEQDRTSRLREQDTELIETKDPTPEKMETTLDKGSEGVAENTERSESKPAIESSDLLGGSKAGGTLKKREQSSEVPELKRSVRKSKRERKLSSSTSSDEEQSSSPPKASTSRPKKARCDKMAETTHSTRHDSGGSVPKRVSPGNPEETEPASTPESSDFTPSFSSSESAL